MTTQRAIFLPCYLDGLPETSPSVRWRARWVAKYWDRADIYDGRQSIDDYDVGIFQKFYLTGRARSMAGAMRAGGKTLVFDLCDPDFLEEEHRRRMLKILPLFDFAVATTEPIRDWLATWLPAYVIPDRIDLEVHPEKKRYDEPLDRVRLVWYGFAHNAPSLQSLWPTIEELGLSLTVISDEPQSGTWLHEHLGQYSDLVAWLPWALETVNAQIVEHDIALNPQPVEVDEVFRYKSHNKDLTARALGIAIAKTADDLVRLLDFWERKAEAECRLEEVRERWDVRLSVEEWKQLLERNE